MLAQEHGQMYKAKNSAINDVGGSITQAEGVAGEIDGGTGTGSIGTGKAGRSLFLIWAPTPLPQYGVYSQKPSGDQPFLTFYASR